MRGLKKPYQFPKKNAGWRFCNTTGRLRDWLAGADIAVLS
jgi:hypothetical protein